MENRDLGNYLETQALGSARGSLAGLPTIWYIRGVHLVGNRAREEESQQPRRPRLDHRQRDAVFDTAAGIGRLQLGIYISPAGRDDTVQLDQRSAADKLQTVFGF